MTMEVKMIERDHEIQRIADLHRISREHATASVLLSSYMMMGAPRELWEELANWDMCDLAHAAYDELVRINGLDCDMLIKHMVYAATRVLDMPWIPEAFLAIKQMEGSHD